MAKITYANLRQDRDNPLQMQLEALLKEAAEAAGVDEVVIVSGGQEPRGASPDNIFGRYARTGSTRHDLGGAADVRLIKDGQVLNFTDNRGVFETFVTESVRRGATGIGAGPGHMDGSTEVHVGYGTPAYWGRDDSSRNAPAWLASAYRAGQLATPIQPAGISTTPRQRPTAPTYTRYTSGLGGADPAGGDTPPTDRLPPAPSSPPPSPDLRPRGALDPTGSRSGWRQAPNPDDAARDRRLAELRRMARDAPHQFTREMEAEQIRLIEAGIVAKRQQW
jgi:hypothetical protein